jgi:ABC-type glycerol-3-phosphate transport system permease component
MTYRRIEMALTYAVLILLSLILAAPLIFLIITSLKLDFEYITYPFRWLPSTPQWINYEQVFTMTRYGEVLFRTFVISVGTSAICTLTSSMAGFAFARIKAPGSKIFFSVVISMLIVPGIVLLIPQFIIYARLKFTNTYWPWIFGAIAGSPYLIFMFRQFFLGFPKELEEAAEVDGCGPFRIFWQIFFPNSLPVFATAFILQFLGVWGDYLMPLMLLSADKTFVGVILAKVFVNPQGIFINTVTMAATVLYLIPPIILFFLGQRYILKSVVTSGIKG